MEKVLRNLTFTAAGFAKTLSWSPQGCCVGQCMCWLVPARCSSHRSGTHWGKPSPCRTISAVGHQTDVGVLGSSEAGTCHSPPIPARNPYLLSKPIQQQFESQNQSRACIVPSPTALGPVFPELQMAQLSVEALYLISGTAAEHATVGLTYFWVFLRSCCSSCIFRNTDGSLQIHIIFWLHPFFECKKLTQILQCTPMGYPEYLRNAK